MSVCAYPKSCNIPTPTVPSFQMESRHRSGISSLEARARARSQEQYIMKKAVTAALLAMMMAASVQAADKVTTVPVHFAKGAHSAKVDGTFSGYDTINYTLGAKEGQTMTSPSPAAPMPTSTSSHRAPSRVRPRHWAAATWTQNGKGTLPKSGKYLIQVYQMRATARNGQGPLLSVGIPVTDANIACVTNKKGPRGSFFVIVLALRSRGQPQPLYGQQVRHVEQVEGGGQHAEQDHQDDHEEAAGGAKPSPPSSRRGRPHLPGQQGRDDAGPQGRHGAPHSRWPPGSRTGNSKGEHQGAAGRSPPRTWRGHPGCCRTDRSAR